ncbi:transcriptional regulator [Brachybacterium alimentarium]|uniref:Transcriptional regulator n=1 Tax=Brachybacterium alimentarium TaxID=47845 RepID=A0A2A3YMJ6_9MICO|nr:transcriptional regulator [Brachybacterium alimentarium]RCS82034.1 transcriptional regulator [Brachybacterium alimentarium]
MANRLPVLRAERRWSQAELADRINVSRQTVGSLESGRYEPTLRVAMRLSAVFDVPLEDIFTPDPEDIALIRIE